MKTYLVHFRKPDHDDEWENRYTEECVENREGLFVYAKPFSWGACLAFIPPEDIIEVEEV